MLGRGVHGYVAIVIVAGFNPSTLAVNVILPALRLDCTMTSASPLKMNN